MACGEERSEKQEKVRKGGRVVSGRHRRVRKEMELDGEGFR